ncbi:protein MMS22-like [Oratosquilla oratoria]|uniref:protein MMS22-like n=1 Tax=Oratosquilla oratoria TaxID=337810 RepID=UPI003F76684A
MEGRNDGDSIPGTSMSMTPPLTPPKTNGDCAFDSDSLDYLDFFTSDVDPFVAAEKPEVKEIEAIDEGPLWFVCRGSVSQGDKGIGSSLVTSGTLNALLHGNNPCPQAFKKLPFIFHAPCTPDTLHYNLEYFFTCVRQTFGELEQGTVSSGPFEHTQQHAKYASMHQDIALFFNCLVSYVAGIQTGRHEGFMKKLLIEIQDLLKYIGPLHVLPAHVALASSTLGNKCSSASYHLLHSHLDVRWWCLSLLYMVEGAHSPMLQPEPTEVSLISEPSGPDGLLLDKSLLGQVFSLIFWDLTTTATRCCDKKNPDELLLSSSFSCTCMQELCLLAQHVMQHRHSSLNKSGYIEQVRLRILAFAKLTGTNHSPNQVNEDQNFDVISFPSSVFRNSKPSHVWCLMVDIIHCFKYDDMGRELEHRQDQNADSKLIKTLFSITLSDILGRVPTELEIRFYIHCGIKIAQVWGYSTDWVAVLWEFFSKRLDESFLLPGAGLSGLAFMSKTASGWVEQVKGHSRKVPTALKTESSWLLFLRIMAAASQGEKEWRQLKGRVFSKFSQSKIKALSATGLHNAITLYLTLAHSTDILDLSTKMTSLLNLENDFDSQSFSKLFILLRGHIALVLLLVEKGCDIAPLAPNIKNLITYGCHGYTTAREPNAKRDFGQLATMYAEGLQEVYEQSNDLTLSQHSLLCPAVTGYLKNCSIIELKALLSAAHSVLAKVLSTSTRQVFDTGGQAFEVVRLIWQTFGTFLKNHATTATPPPLLGSTAALLTLCLGLAEQRGQTTLPKDLATSLFSHFVANEIVCPVATVHYVSSLLDEPGSVTIISASVKDFDALMVGGWLRSLVSRGECEEVVALTQLVPQLPSVASVVPNWSNNPFIAAESLVSAVAQKFKQIEVLMSRISYRDSVMPYFTGLDKTAVALMKKSPAPAHLDQAFQLIGHIFYHAASLIYIKGNATCPLPNLLNGLILPHTIYSADKPLSRPCVAALAQALPQILCGLASMGTVGDAYLARCIRAIFVNYIYRFPLVTSTGHSSSLFHPFYSCVYDDNLKSEAVYELRIAFLESVRDGYLLKKTVCASHLKLVLSLLGEILNRSPIEWVGLMCKFIFVALLEQLLLLEDPSNKRLATELLKKLFEEAQKHSIPPREDLVEYIKSFVTKHMLWHPARLFKLLGVLSILHRQVITESFHHITLKLEEAENKRGSGRDAALRTGYRTLQLNLGLTPTDVD